MITLEELRGKMLAQGCSLQSINSKGVAIAFDIISNAGGAYADLKEAERKRDVAEHEAERAAIRVQRKQYALEEEKAEFFKQYQKAKEYIQTFKEALENCETPEARDALKRAQVFRESVEVNTKYDNTAYIIGLSALLSGVTLDPLKEIKKINNRLFSV